MTKFKVLVADPVDEAFLEKVRPHVDVEVNLKLSEEELLKKVEDVDALVVRSRTKVTRRVVEAAKKLKAIIRAGVGVDNIDMEAAKEGGIAVVNTPREPAQSVAELTMALALCLARRIPFLDRSMKSGRWIKGEAVGFELRGKVMGIVGLGSIGSTVARLAQAFGMKVVAYDPYITHERASSLGVELVSFQELLSTSDFISIHVPLTPETRGMIGREEVERMKHGAFIINTSRGGIVDEEALYEALKKGKLGGAALDVYSKEPPPDHPLLKLDSVICTPHIGGSTPEAQLRIALAMAEDLLRVVRGEEPVNKVRA